MHKIHTGEKGGVAHTPARDVELIAKACLRGQWFTLDACATDDNAICPRHITPEDDFITITRDFGNEVIWMNPPYTKTRDGAGYTISDFMSKASMISNRYNCKICVLLESNMTATRYFNSYVGATKYAREHNRCWLYFPPRRINFILPGRPRASSHNTKSSMVVVYEPMRPGDFIFGFQGRWGCRP